MYTTLDVIHAIVITLLDISLGIQLYFGIKEAVAHKKRWGGKR